MRTTAARVYTEAPTGGSRVWLDRLGLPCVLTGLQWMTTYPGGDASWQANLTFDMSASHAGLMMGRTVVIESGGGIRFRGTLDKAERGQPWQLQGSGLASIGAAFTAVDSSGNAYNLDNIVTQAIARNLAWTKPGTLGTAGSKASGTCTIGDSLAAVGKALGQAWTLSAAGAISMAAPPTTPSFVLRAQQALTPTVTGYTQAVGLYQSTSTAAATVTASNAAAVARWGYREGRYDMTSLGVISSGTATTYLTNWLTANLTAPTYTTTLTAQTGLLVTPYGAPVDLATVRAGCLVTVFDVDPTHDHLLTPGPLQVLIGQTSYDVDNDILTLTPVGYKGQSFIDLLYQGVGGAI